MQDALIRISHRVGLRYGVLAVMYIATSSVVIYYTGLASVADSLSSSAPFSAMALYVAVMAFTSLVLAVLSWRMHRFRKAGQGLVMALSSVAAAWYLFLAVSGWVALSGPGFIEGNAVIAQAGISCIAIVMVICAYDLVRVAVFSGKKLQPVADAPAE